MKKTPEEMIENFIESWNVGHEDKEQKIEFAEMMREQLNAIAQCQQDNAERKYTEVDMIEFSKHCGLYDFHIHHQIWVSKINFRIRKTTKELFDEFLTSLNKQDK